MEAARALRKTFFSSGSVGILESLMGVSMSGRVAKWDRLPFAGTTMTSTDSEGVFDLPDLGTKRISRYCVESNARILTVVLPRHGGYL